MRPSLRAAVKTLLEVNMSGWLRFTASFSTLAGLSLAMVSLWGCSAQEEVQSLEKRVTALEAALMVSAPSDEAVEDLEAPPAPETEVEEEIELGLEEDDEEDNEEVCAEPEAQGTEAPKLDRSPPAKSSVDDAAWLKEDQESACASKERCSLSCPDGGRLVRQSKAYYCTLLGRRHGPYVNWYDSGVRQSQGSYRDGRKDGVWRAWHPNGRRQGIATHSADNAHKGISFVSTVETFSEVDLVKSPGKRVFTQRYNDASELDGASHNWAAGSDANWVNEGDLISLEEISYKGGKRDGPSRIFDTSGALIGEQMFKAGTPDGHKRSWTSSGQLTLDMTYKQGEPHGPKRRWSSSGFMTLDMTYEDGVPVGKRRQWSGKCALRQVDHFKRGKLDGKLSIWHSYPDQLKERSHFKLGERDGLSETWTSGGMMIRKHEHVAGKRHGESSGWHPNSQRAFETYWFHGKPDREVLAWHPSGAPAVIGAYTEGRKVKLGCYDVQGKKAGCKAIKDAIWDEW